MNNFDHFDNCNCTQCLIERMCKPEVPIQQLLRRWYEYQLFADWFYATKGRNYDRFDTSIFSEK
jgi:hypothetical protein